MAVMRLLTWTSMNFFFFISIKWDSSPSFHISACGTSCTGSTSAILQELSPSGWSSPVLSLKYVRFLRVVDLGSDETILTSILTSLLGEDSSFL